MWCENKIRMSGGAANVKQKRNRMRKKNKVLDIKYRTSIRPIFLRRNKTVAGKDNVAQRYDAM